MSIEDFKKMECVDRIKFVRSCIRQAGFENPDEHLGACLAVLDRFESGESLKDKSNNTYTITAKLSCEDESFSKAMDKAKEKTDKLAISAGMVNEELDRLQANLSELGLVVDKGKLGFKCSVQSDD